MGSSEASPSSDQPDPVAGLAAALGHDFSDRGLLVRALTHPSAAPQSSQRSRGVGDHNERLEFLGDRVLGLVMAELLFQRFSDEREGQLARRFAGLVSREALAEVAGAIDLKQYLLLAKGEEGAGERDNPALLANACEAVIAALYLDGGLDVAGRFIKRHWESLVAADRRPPREAKTSLQEWAQARGLPLPLYQEQERRGPAHDPVFTVQVTVEGFAPRQAEGRSKRLAEQAAARALLDDLEGRGL